MEQHSYGLEFRRVGITARLKALIVGRKLDDKIRLGSAHSMADKQVQGQQAKATTIENNASNGGNTAVELEFRPNNGANSIGDCNLNNGSQSARSKSPGGHIINKISNFARGKYRNSLSEKQTNSVNSDDKVRKDINRELTRCRESGETRLDLNSSENKLSSLPPAVGQLINLRILGLSENSLSTLPDTLSSLKKLETLDLRHNKINEEIPAVVFQMESLETLWLRYNKIRTISPNIKCLKRLKMLDLRENKITELPTVMSEMKCLSILLLSSNHLKAIPEEIGQCSQLTQLDLQHNELVKLPENIEFSLVSK
uniref:Leucine-rich repeat protein soc-2 homolog n=1 Tax=Meloidogyne javanica TaxID=6303 RepID=A0A915LK94_MELJA